MYTYTWYQWLAFFYLYCFFGWIFESTYVSLKKKKFVNRGFLRLPMLPLYGSGAVMMLWVSLPVHDNLLLVYISGFIAATALEYVTGAVMERLFKVRYWDYSNQPFQLNGYICLSSSIAWGFLTIFMTDVIHEPIARAVLAVSPVVLITCDFVISVLFTADIYESTKAALALGHTLEAMTKLKADIETLQSHIELLREEAIEPGKRPPRNWLPPRPKLAGSWQLSRQRPKNVWRLPDLKLPDSFRLRRLNILNGPPKPGRWQSNALQKSKKIPAHAWNTPKQNTPFA